MALAPREWRKGRSAASVARGVYARSALANLERAFDFLAKNDPGVAVAAAGAIRSAIEALAAHPLIGRPVADTPLRELVISFGRTGYVALYRFVPARNEVRVLGIRHQRELDYPA